MGVFTNSSCNLKNLLILLIDPVNIDNLQRPQLQNLFCQRKNLHQYSAFYFNNHLKVISISTQGYSSWQTQSLRRLCVQVRPDK